MSGLLAGCPRLRQFIKDFARISKPLQDLTHIGARFKWGLEQQEAFEKIKRAVVEVAHLAHPVPGREFLIYCDASTVGLGAVLAQKGDKGRERPSAFASRLLRENEKHCSTTELEAYAVVWALETFRGWVEGSPALVRTGHSPLPWLKNSAGKSAKIVRWVFALQSFAFDLKHRSGRCQNVPVALSRYATGNPEGDHEEMCTRRGPGRPGAYVAAPSLTALAGVCGDQHAFSAGGGRAAII